MKVKGGEESIAMIILAAGASKRMSCTKQILPWKNTTLLGNAIEKGLDSNINQVYVVLGAHSKLIEESISKYPVQIIINNKWQKGIGSSISCALEFFKLNKLTYKSVLVSLGDMPLIEVDYYNLLIKYSSAKKERIIASNINNKPSVPAVFDNCYFEKLLHLNSDKGAKDIMRSVPDDVFIINANVNFVDVDTEIAYKEILYSCK